MDKKKQQISLVETYKKLISNITDEHVLYLQLFVAVILGFLILYVFSKRVIRTISGSSILLVGGCEAGKTSLLHTLANEKDDKTPITVTSFKESVGIYNSGQKKIRIVDIPGHERVRNSAFDRHKSDARAIIFMLDSATLQTQVRDVAEQLFTILSDGTIHNSSCPIVVVCNKQDQELAKSAVVIERALQREIEVLRETTSNRLESIESDGSNKKNNIGISGQPFTFSDLTRNSITFIEATVLNSKDLGGIKSWIAKV